MNRRKFIQSLTALAISSSLPVNAIERWQSDGFISGEYFKLYEPMTLDMPTGFIIENCTFEAMVPGLHHLLWIRSGDDGLINDCTFLCNGSDYAIKFHEGGGTFGGMFELGVHI